jgi:hypothetical protein
MFGKDGHRRQRNRRGATVAPEKGSSKKAASARKGAPKRQKIAKGGNSRALRVACCARLYSAIQRIRVPQNADCFAV